MSDPYLNGYGNLFPDSNLVSAVFKMLNSGKIDVFPDTKVTKCLDVGCGIGANLRFLEYFPSMCYVGVDTSPHAAKLAHEQIIRGGYELRASIHTGTIEDFLSSCNEKFDLILDRASIQHLEVMTNAESGSIFLESLLSKLNTGGVLISLWAGQLNLDTNKRFSAFSAFESYSTVLQRLSNDVSLTKIVKTRMYDEREEISTLEYLVTLVARS